MCGVAGVKRFDGAPVDAHMLEEMGALVAHRGPDDAGLWISGSVGMTHRRLSIIDVNGSAQPMATYDGRLHVSFNGEIYNYREVRAALDYPFVTRGDTEALLAAWHRHGVGALARLQGQFAFALHDAVDDRLVLVRDRMGILPLYYYCDERMIAFASEAKALLPALPRAPSVDTDALADYLAHRSTPAPHTLFAGVRKVRPGHVLAAGPDGRVTEAAYWSIPGPDEQLDVTDDEAVALVGEALGDAVRSALVADVPVGAYLSGGVDSSLITALMSEQHGGPVQTYSAGFTGSSDDETPVARLVSARLGTTHHEVRVGPDDFLDDWARLTWHRDAPLSEPADVAVHRLAALARRDVKVVLSGEGSDELFAGYPKYRAARWVEALDVVPEPLRQPAAARIAHSLPASAARLRAPLRAVAAGPDERVRSWFAPFSADERARLLGRSMTARPGPGREAGAEGEGDVVRRMLHADCHAWLADNLLERGDRMSMAASLELRPPFLDHRLVELAFRLPTRVKLRHGHTKWVVKQVALDRLPESVVHRRKVGFRVPLDRWFRGTLQTFVRDSLCSRDSFVSSVLDRQLVQALVDRHAAGRSDEAIQIWTLLGLEMWHDQFFGAHAPVRAVARRSS